MLDKFNILRQMMALPKNTGHLIVHSILGRLLPVTLALHVVVAMTAYMSRSQQLLELGAHDTHVGAPQDSLDSELARVPSEELHALPDAVVYMGYGGLAVFIILAIGQLLYHLDRRSEAQSLGTRYAQMSATSDKLYAAQDGIGLYISPVQRAILTELATKRGNDMENSSKERAAFTGDSVALSFEAFV
jgi:hypothetical protein